MIEKVIGHLSSKFSKVSSMIVLIFLLVDMTSGDQIETFLLEEEQIFNGINLDGLTGDKSLWRVENGELIGATKSKRDPENFSWLVTEDSFQDFELTLWCKLSGDRNRNSGVYYRGKWNEEQEVIGYEYDLGGWGGEKELWWGELHDPFDRGFFASPMLEKKELIDLYNKKGWNHVKIRVKGNHIQHWLNGLKTMDWIEPDSAYIRKGFIGFQMHNETKFQVRFRDIKLRKIGN